MGRSSGRSLGHDDIGLSPQGIARRHSPIWRGRSKAVRESTDAGCDGTFAADTTYVVEGFVRNLAICKFLPKDCMTSFCSFGSRGIIRAMISVNPIDTHPLPLPCPGSIPSALSRGVETPDR
jgi:hypothetical protein